MRLNFKTVLTPFFFLLSSCFMGCTKKSEDNPELIKENIIAVDQYLAMCYIALDIAARFPNDTPSLIAPQNGLHCEWTDSIFDTNGITAYLHFTSYDTLNQRTQYALDHKVRNGIFKLHISHPISQNECNITLSTTPQNNVLLGYTAHKTYALKNIYILLKKSSPSTWEFNIDSGIISRKQYDIHFKNIGLIKLNEPLIQSGLWGKTLTCEFKQETKSNGMKTIQTTNPLKMQFMPTCSALYTQGDISIQTEEKKWQAIFNILHNNKCDRYIRLKSGQTEYLYELIN